MYWLFELIYKHGDIERHPGPSVQPNPGQTKREDPQREETATRTGKGEKSTVKKWQEKWKRMMSKPARYITECWGRKPQENEREKRICIGNTSEIQKTVTNVKMEENENRRSTPEAEKRKGREGGLRERKEEKRTKKGRSMWRDTKRDLAQVRKRLKRAEKHWDEAKRKWKRGHITQTEKAQEGRQIHKIRIRAKQMTNRQERERQRRDEGAMQEAWTEIQKSQATRLAETALTIQTLRKVMRRTKYDMDKRKGNRQEKKENSDVDLQIRKEEKETRWEEETGNTGGREWEGTHMEEGRETKQENSRKENQWESETDNKREGRRGTLAKVKQKARWMMELIYRHGDVHRHPGPSTTSNRQEIGEQEENRKTEQKVCEICRKATGKRTCERCREVYYGTKPKKHIQTDQSKKETRYRRSIQEGQLEIKGKAGEWKEWCTMDGDKIEDRELGVMRIGTWNIRKKAVEGYATGHVQSKIEIILDYMKTLDIQIMALQEVGEGEENKRALEFAVNRKEYKIYVNPNKHGLAIIIHKEVERHRSRVAVDKEGSYIELLLRPTSARGYKNKASVALYNIHMEKDESLTEESALPKRLQSIIRIQREKNRKVGVIGDWNCAPALKDRMSGNNNGVHETKRYNEIVKMWGLGNGRGGEGDNSAIQIEGEEPRLEEIRPITNNEYRERLTSQNGDVFRNRHPDLEAYTRSEEIQSKARQRYEIRRSRIDLMVVDKEMLKDIQTATIVRNTCLDSDHELSVFDMRDQWLHIRPYEKEEEERRHRSTPKNWTKEQQGEYTELTRNMEKIGDIGEDENIDEVWVGWANRIEDIARTVQGDEYRAGERQVRRNPKNREGGVGKPFASKDTRR